jgi:hypothetical protein
VAFALGGSRSGRQWLSAHKWQFYT